MIWKIYYWIRMYAIHTIWKIWRVNADELWWRMSWTKVQWTSNKSWMEVRRMFDRSPMKVRWKFDKHQTKVRWTSNESPMNVEWKSNESPMHVGRMSTHVGWKFNEHLTKIRWKFNECPMKIGWKFDEHWTKIEWKFDENQMKVQRTSDESPTMTTRRTTLRTPEHSRVPVRSVVMADTTWQPQWHYGACMSSTTTLWGMHELHDDAMGRAWTPPRRYGACMNSMAMVGSNTTNVALGGVVRHAWALRC